MTGSVLAAVVIPIVTFLALIAWIALVFYADAHPPGRGRHAHAPGGAYGGSASQGVQHEVTEEPPETERRAA
jgi:hypothetical protein